MGITLLTKEITPKNIFYRNEIQYRDDVPTKRKVGMCEVTKLITCLTCNININFPLSCFQIVTCVHLMDNSVTVS